MNTPSSSAMVPIASGLHTIRTCGRGSRARSAADELPDGSQSAGVDGSSAGATASARPRHARLHAGARAGGLLVVYPVLLLINSFEVGAVRPRDALGLGQLARGRYRAAARHRHLEHNQPGRYASGLSLVLAIGIAWLLASTDLPGSRWLEFGFWVTVFLPNLTVLVAWIMMFDGFNGLANQVLQKLPFVTDRCLTSTPGGASSPRTYSVARSPSGHAADPAFRNLDSSLEEARSRQAPAASRRSCALSFRSWLRRSSW